jgi:hypothetical protein
MPRDKIILQRCYLREETKTGICDGLNLPNENFDQVVCRVRQRLREVVAFQEQDVLFALFWNTPQKRGISE